MRAWHIILFSAACAAAPCARAHSHALSTTNNIVHSIHISGAVRTSPERLRTLILSRIGEPASPRQISRTIAALAALPDIHNVVVTATPSFNGFDLIFAIQEAPLIAALSASRDTPRRRLPRRPLAPLQPGLPFSPATLFDATRALQDYFHRHHFHAVMLSSAVVRLPGTNLVNVSLYAHEGVRQYISEITIYGNRAFSAAALRRMLHCTPRNRWLFRSGAFQPAQFETDRQRILGAYLARGYLDARIAISTRTAAHSNEIAAIVSVFEGPRYTVGELTWRARGLPSNHLARLQQHIALDNDMPYTPDLPDALRARIAEVSRAAHMPVPGIVIRTLLAPQSSPAHPSVTIAVTLITPGLPLNEPRPVITYPLMRVTSF